MTLLSLAVTALAQVPPETWSEELWHAPIAHMELVCLTFDPDAGGKDSWSVVLPEATVTAGSTLALDPKVPITERPSIGAIWREAADSGGEDVCVEVWSYHIIAVTCTNACRCSHTCDDEGGWVCQSTQPEYLGDFSRSVGSPFSVRDFECTQPDPTDPDPDGPGYPA